MKKKENAYIQNDNGIHVERGNYTNQKDLTQKR
jgi:hypothetical protein